MNTKMNQHEILMLKFDKAMQDFAKKNGVNVKVSPHVVFVKTMYGWEEPFYSPVMQFEIIIELI